MPRGTLEWYRYSQHRNQLLEAVLARWIGLGGLLDVDPVLVGQSSPNLYARILSRLRKGNYYVL